MVQVTPGQHLNGHIKFEMRVPNASIKWFLMPLNVRMRPTAAASGNCDGTTLEKILFKI